MALPWVRFDTNMMTHDKILDLLCDDSEERWQAVASYMFSIQWSGGHGTDGRIPKSALGAIHGTLGTAELLVKYRLWDRKTAAWEIRNYAEYQVTDAVDKEVTGSKKRASAKGNCRRWHGPDCRCWELR